MAQAVDTARVLIVDDNMNALRALEYVLDRAGFDVDCAASGSVALDRLRKSSYDVVVSDLKMPGMSGLELLNSIQSFRPGLPVLILTAHGTIDNAVEAVRHGAVDYLQKPFPTSDIAAKVRAALEQHVNDPTAPSGEEEQCEVAQSSPDPHEMVGTSEPIHKIKAQIETVAKKDIAVIIYGESGTGKELAARALHRLSPRADRPFVAVNCASIPETLLENELFGHVRGAYTGANSTEKGLFEEAHTGTIFLDEIGDIPGSLQAKLLRVLQEREFKKVGGTRDIRVDVRLITATNQDLREAVAAGRFREDLFYRINVVPLVMPALRQRSDDVPGLAQHFRTLFNTELGLKIKGFDDNAIACMVNFPWPGNVRELRNRVKMAMVMAQQELITADDLGFTDEGDVRPFPPYRDAKESFERHYVVRALKVCSGNVKKAAKLAGRDRSTFYDLLKKYEIDADSFRESY